MYDSETYKHMYVCLNIDKFQLDGREENGMTRIQMEQDPYLAPFCLTIYRICAKKEMRSP